MTDYHHLRAERGATGLTRVTFARPPANALNSQVIDDVQRCAEELIAAGGAPPAARSGPSRAP